MGYDINAQDGLTFDHDLTFSFECRPANILIGRVRKRVPALNSSKALESFMEKVFAGASIREARRYFVEIPIEESSGEGTIETFRPKLAHELLAPLEQNLGCEIQDWSIECIPLLPPEIADAAVKKLAARYDAHAENAWTSFVLDEIKAQGAPPELIVYFLTKLAFLERLSQRARIYGNHLTNFTEGTEQIQGMLEPPKVTITDPRKSNQLGDGKNNLSSSSKQDDDFNDDSNVVETKQDENGLWIYDEED